MLDLNAVKAKLRQSHAAAKAYLNARHVEGKHEAKARKLNAQVHELQEQLKAEMVKWDAATREKNDAIDSCYNLKDEARLMFTAHVDGASEDKARAWAAHLETLGQLGLDPTSYEAHKL